MRRLRRYALEVRAGVGRSRLRRRLPAGELGELAQAMDQMRHRLEQPRAISNTRARLTHELKSPLTAIAGAAELLGTTFRRPTARASRSRSANRSSGCENMVEQMLELSKLESLRGPPASGELLDPVA